MKNRNCIKPASCFCIFLCSVILIFFFLSGCRENNAELRRKAGRTGGTDTEAPFPEKSEIIKGSDHNEPAAAEAKNNNDRTDAPDIPAADPGGRAAPDTDGPAVTEAQPDTESITGRYFLISVREEKYFIPSDFETGRLIENSAENSRYISFIKSFFGTLEKGNPVDRYFREENRVFLVNVFRRYKEEDHIPDRVRIGSPVPVNNSMHFNLRLFKGEGRAEARIVLTETDGYLLIRDFYGDLSVLDQKYEPEEGLFEPEKYSF